MNEVFWGINFSGPLSEIEISDKTRCTVQGLFILGGADSVYAREQEVCRFGESQKGFRNSEYQQDVNGIDCSLGALAHGDVEAVLTVVSKTDKDSRIFCRLNLQGIDFREIVPWLKDKQEKILENCSIDTEFIALGEYTRFQKNIANRHLKYKVALAAARGVTPEDIPVSHIEKAFEAENLNYRRFIPVGSGAVISLRDSKGRIVSSRKLIS